ncbi:MAG: PKD domain-containing protein [Acidobacteriota bacterium]|nr:PKD domain-containing protein [Acidobacteriota bacterium]
MTGLWPGGFTNTLTGNILQTDLVPAFAISPNPIALGGTLTLTNRMQIAPAATLNSAEVSVTSGTCGSSTPQFSPLASSFNGVGGTATTVVPSSQGSYCVVVRFNYTSTGGPTSQTAQLPLTVSPTLAVQCSPTSISVGGSVTCTASGGSGQYQWNWGDSFAFAEGPATNQHTYTSSGSQTVAVRDATQQSASASTNITVTGVVNPPPPPPPPPPPAGPSVTISGPSTGKPNDALVFSANASGGAGGYSYFWACDYNSLGTLAQFTAGSASVTCSYASQGVHAVGVRVVDSAQGNAINSIAVTITGPSLPSTAFTVTGASFVSGTTYQVGVGQEVVFTSSETTASSWGWDFGDNTLATGRTSRKTYSGKGSYTGRLIVTGNGTGSAGMAIGTFTIQVVIPPPSGAFTISGANPNGAGTVYTVGVGEEITMTASETHAQSWGWDFGDQTFGGAASVKKTYNSLGPRTLQLIVTGDGVLTTGLTISRFTINVVSCVSNGATLCLNNNRFKATVNWAVPDQDKTGAGVAVPLTADTGYYWFFSPTNIELVLKVVDGRAANGKFWVFYGALSDVQYTITIKDTTTGAVKTYVNPYRRTASVADTSAFDGGGAGASSKGVAATAAGPSLVCTPASVVVNNPVSCSVTGASGSASFRWAWDFCLGGCLVEGTNPQTHTYTTPGVQQVTCVVTEGANFTTITAPVNVTAAPAGGLSAAISGPGTGSTADSLTFTANASSGTSPYSYFWACDYGVSSVFAAGGDTTTCSYTTAGTHTVGLKVTDSAASPAQFIATKNVVLSAPAGPGLPSAAFTLGGAVLNSATGRYEAEIGATVTFTASESNANLYGWAFGDGQSATGKTVTHAYPQGGIVNGQLVVNGDGTRTIGTSVASIPLSILACASDGKTLCLNGGRFKVKVDWKSDTGEGIGTPVPVTADTGEFWFLSANNIELMLKVVDGTSFNGHFWVFYGALSDLEYTITVTDTTTGTVKTYHNPLHTTASVADVNAF